jgi:type I site-specific deoxyribonuclease
MDSITMTAEQQLPKGWTKTTLEEICEIFDSKRVPLNREQREQRINNKKTDELFPYYGATGEVGKIDDYIFDGEFVLLGEDAAPFFEPNKNVAYCVKGKFWVNNHAHILSSSVLENLYICHYLNQFNFSGYVSGTTRLKLSQGSMKRIPIIYPTSKETQQAIVNKIESLFDEIDEGIGRLKTAAQQIQQYRQSLLKNAFNGELTKEWRSKHADTLPSENELLVQIQTAREQHHAQQLADRQTAVSQWEQNGKEGKKPSKPKASTQAVKFEENFADLPSGWIWGKLSDLGELARGKSKHRPRNDKKLFGGKYPFIQTGEVRAANRIIKKYEQTYSEFGLEQSKLWQKGTLCITIAANIAETAFLGFDACFPDSIVGFSASKAVLPEYIELFIKSTRTKIESYAPATAQKNINLNTLENLIVPYCSLAEQTQIVAILESKLTACDQLAAELSKQVKQAELLKQAVLKAAFSGELRE